MKYDVLADKFTKCAWVEKFSSEKAELVEWIVFLVSPVEREFITTVGVISEITGVHGAW